MKILTNKQYEALLACDCKDNQKEKFEELENQITSLKKQALDQVEDTKILMARKDLECENDVIKSSSEKIAEIAKLTLENGKLTKEVEILTKAFENMGFDVKDMKDILNKLVDGIVTKNTINVVK